MTLPAINVEVVALWSGTCFPHRLTEHGWEWRDWPKKEWLPCREGQEPERWAPMPDWKAVPR